MFKTPVQDEELIRQIYLAGGKIFIEAYRPKDKQSSSVKFEFEFKVHNNLGNSSIEWCSFCLENPDKLGQTMEESLKQRLSTSGVAKPGTKRRKRDTMSSEGRNTSIGSPNSSLLSPNSVSGGSPYSFVSEDQQKLMEDISEFAPAGNDLDDIDIDDLLRQEIPDVLRGVMHVEGLPMTLESESESEFDHSSHAPFAHIPPMRTELSPSPDHLSFARCLSPSSPPGASAPSFSPLVKTDISASCGSDLCYTDHVETASAMSWNNETEEIPVRRQEVSDAKPMLMRMRLVKRSVEERKTDMILGNHLEVLETNHESIPKTNSLLSRINNLSPNTKLSSESSSLDNLATEKDKKSEQPIKAASLISRINHLSSSFQKSEDIQIKNEPEIKISTMSLISRLNKVTKNEPSENSIQAGDSAYLSQESVSFNALDSLGSGQILSNVDRKEFETSDASDTEREPKVMEITKKFGGAKKKCMEKIRSKMSRSESKSKLEIKQDLADCLPALIYILTPFIVMVLATIFNFLWTRYFGLEIEIEDSIDGSPNFDHENIINEE